MYDNNWNLSCLVALTAPSARVPWRELPEKRVPSRDTLADLNASAPPWSAEFFRKDDALIVTSQL